ncbi:MAG: hypothetical protein IKU17_09270 [Clostridia bacterium]|nr:hypothetical protein [Clostridia bacterium]
MNRKKTAVLCAVLLLFTALLGACTTAETATYPEPENYTQADVPYDAMDETDAGFVSLLWNEEDWAQYLVGHYGLKEAIRVDGEVYFTNQLGGLGTTKIVPADAEPLGFTVEPCAELTTPQTDLQTNYAPAGCAVYKGWWTVVLPDERSEDWEMFFVQTEPGGKYYALMFVQSRTRPPYYDEGQWMLHPENAAETE